MPTEIITPAEALAADLAPLAEAIASQADLILRHELAAQEETILPRLLIGQSVARAKEIFGLTVQDAGKLGGRPSAETLSRRDTVSQTDPATAAMGFQAWLRKAAPELKRPAALKYEKAFSCLALPADCKPAAITAAVKDLRHAALKSGKPALSLAYIIKAAEPEEKAELITKPEDSATLRLGDAREAFHLWQSAFEKMLHKGQLDDLERKDLLSLKEFALGVLDRINARLK